MASSLFNSLFQRAQSTPATPNNFPFTIETNPYRCKRPWPPDFSQLSHKHQFRLERRFRRRTRLQWARPNWNKAVQLTQWGAILFTLSYGLLYMDIDDRLTPLVKLRAWYNSKLEMLTGTQSEQQTPTAATVPLSVDK